MGFSGDNIVIKDDYTFDRIENLKIGDCLLGPFGNDAIITNITSNYEENVYEFQTENFIKSYISEGTKIFSTKKDNLLNIDTKEFENVYNKPCFEIIEKLMPTHLIAINKFPEYNNSFEYPWLYGKVLNLGNINIINDKKNIVIHPKKTSLNVYSQKTGLNIIKDNSKKIIYINDADFSWIDTICNKPHHKYISNEMFFSSVKNIEEFLTSLLKENTEIYINNKEFRCYFESKILTIQLFYLLLMIYKELPIVETCKKDNIAYKKISQSNKKKKYSITMFPDFKTEIFDELFLQEIKTNNKIKKSIKIYNIETLNEESFYVNNFIVKGD